MSNKCSVKHCTRQPVLIYYGKDVCNVHWLKHCNGNNKFNLKEVLNIK